MWAYEKKLQYPVKIKNPNPLYAKIIISQLGGPDGELGAALRYLNQRYTMPYGDIIGILTDVGTEAGGQRPLDIPFFQQKSAGKKPAPKTHKKICDFQNSGAVSLYKVNKELLFFFFGQAFVAENKDLCLNLVEGLFTEIADMNQSFIGKRIHNVLDHKIARSFQSVVRTNGKFDIIDIGLTSFFGKSDADADLRPDDLIDRIQKADFLCGIVKLQRNLFFSHIA